MKNVFWNTVTRFVIGKKNVFFLLKLSHLLTYDVHVKSEVVAIFFTHSEEIDNDAGIIGKSECPPKGVEPMAFR